MFINIALFYLQGVCLRYIFMIPLRSSVFFFTKRSEQFTLGRILDFDNTTITVLWNLLKYYYRTIVLDTVPANENKNKHSFDTILW